MPPQPGKKLEEEESPEIIRQTPPPQLYFVFYKADMCFCSDKHATYTFNEIIEVSRKKNKQHGITSVLYTERQTEENFMGVLNYDVYQYIEGPRAAIIQLYRNIIRDTRCYNLVHIKMGWNPGERLYKDWMLIMAKKEDCETDITIEMLKYGTFANVVKWKNDLQKRTDGRHAETEAVKLQS